MSDHSLLKHPHTGSPEAITELLESSADGLTSAQAKQRLASHGPNQLPEPPVPSAFRRFLAQFNNLLIMVLVAAALITALLGHWLDTAVILAVVVVNTVLGFVQEGKAEKAIASIRNMLAPQANVLRDGQREKLPAEQLVPGDLVLLEAGDKVPADLRLLQVSSLEIQESLLTGESVPVSKQTKAVAIDAPLGDRSGMAFSGTLVTSGQGRGIVVSTGAATELGRIGHLLTDVQQISTPLLRQISQLSKWLTGFIFAMALSVLAFGYLLRGMPFDELFVIVVGLSVAAIPEGLPAVLTVTLAIGVQAMARRNAVVRRLPAIETLGALSVICTDKTGTLTRNEMMVASVVFADQNLKVSGEGYEPAGEITAQGHPVAPDRRLQWLAKAAALCNDSELVMQEGQWQVLGDPMEGALLRFSGKAGIDLAKLQQSLPRQAQIPFDARHRYMVTAHSGEVDVLLVKGAPESLLEMCSTQMLADGGTAPIELDYWHREAQEIAAQGQRVLAFAIRTSSTPITELDHQDVASELVFIGFTGLIDPPRSEAIEAVQECQRAGIEVKMITGDHAGTAAAIGRQIGLRLTETALTGQQIDEMSDEQLSQAVLSTDVFARTSPEHKLRLVTALQAQNKVVAMTGDGVNDSPALKRADVGIAMGRNGSEAAKEAAELVLLDDNFASIAVAIRKGRTVYDNLRKVISFLLPINGGESLSLIIAILFALTLPITAAQILWVNMVSSVALALALAFEKSESAVMQRPPRPAAQALLSAELLWRILLVTTLFTLGVFGQFILTQQQGSSLEVSRTMAVNTLVAMEVFYLFSVRYSYGTSITLRGVMGTPAVLWSIGAVTVFQLLFTYVPWMNLAFGTAALSAPQLLQVAVFGVLVMLLIELEKWLRSGLISPSRASC
ncbi:ATPase, P-type (Transporting), HAD superfamily, subfamily IC [Pseudohongiella spirulinae]|uniref:ATPase, P-type (Transporting), HAD superfamily, subfamily IC n=1 Tax=Pseudohongiella spirulinae TaxID=1249552 RepID=A0A0S2KAM3_9GAMM|nr:cation-transporting P-type ATPase [Pseudohongiella spirulinae]ALO45257.1 ATPase, P-type (Transporting), HAD superfamily, subfamily IC [Pseudohongiella spirulinae]